MKSLILLTIVLFFCIIVDAQTSDNNSKIGLVLSGGGAKGFAHVGVLKVLEEAKIPIDFIAGTSIGSIVGGLYAIGYDAVTLEKMVKSQDWEKLLSNETKPEFVSPFDKAEESRYNVSFPFESKGLSLSNGVLNGQNAMELLSYLTYGFHSISDFSKLPIPFLCIATDLTNGDEIVLKSGYLPLAMRASMAIPAVFSSCQIGDMMLVDGGVVNNYPVDRCLQMGADIIIGVDIMDSLKTNEQLKGIPDVVSQMMNFMGMYRSKNNSKKVDVFIRPYISDYSPANFELKAAEVLIKRGEDAARRMLPELIRLRDSLHREPIPRNLHKFPNNDTIVHVSDIEVVGTDRAKIAFYLGQAGIQHDQYVSLEHLKSSISRLYASGNYEYVNYQLDGEENKIMRISVKERKNNKINAGLHYDSDFRSSLLVNVTLRNQKFFGSRLSMDVKLSGYPMYAVHYSIDRGWKPGIFAKFIYYEDHFYRYDSGKEIADINNSNINLQVATHSYVTDATRFSLGLSMDKFGISTALGDVSNIIFDQKPFFNLFAKLEHNRLDKVYFPTKGTNIHLWGKLTHNTGMTQPILIGDFYLKRARSFSPRFTLLYDLDARMIFGETESYFQRTFLGGLQQIEYFDNQIPFGGLNRMEINSGTVVEGKIEGRLRMWQKVFVSLTGQVAAYSEDNLLLTNNKFIFSTGVNAAYNSVVGPLEFNMSFCNYNKKVMPFLSLGYWF